MRKTIINTKVSVKLRKSEYADEWYVYLEAYPVFKPGCFKVIREREYLNRIITTPIWDKNRTARTTETKTTYKPKRDANGIIQCRSTADQEVCIYADNVRKLRQRSMRQTYRKTRRVLLAPHRLTSLRCQETQMGRTSESRRQISS